MPLFVRENSLLPVAEPVQQVARDPVFQVTVKVFGEHPVPFTLYEDDGTTFDFEKGEVNRVELMWHPAEGGQVRRKGSFPLQRYQIVGWEAVRSP